jgi:hypothetical protein
VYIDTEQTQRLNYFKTNELLFNMGFLSGKASSDTTERILLLDMWKILQGEENNGIHENNIRKFLQACLGFSHYVAINSVLRKSNSPKKDKQ